MYRLLLAVVLMATLCVTVSALRCYMGAGDNYQPHDCGPLVTTCLTKTTTAGGICMLKVFKIIFVFFCRLLSLLAGIANSCKFVSL